jgi:hypothetical protein
MAPRLLASLEAANDHAVLYLELLRPISSWPWRTLGTARVEQPSRCFRGGITRATCAVSRRKSLARSPAEP